MSKEQNYPTDLTDEQWALIRYLLPKRKRGKPGRPRRVEQRAILNAIFYLLRRTKIVLLMPSGNEPGMLAPPGRVGSESGLSGKIYDRRAGTLRYPCVNRNWWIYGEKRGFVVGLRRSGI
jgi:transposase